MAFIELGKRQHCDLITSSVASKKARTQPTSQGVPIYVYVKSLCSQQNLGHWNQKDQGLSPTSAFSGSVTLGKLSTSLSSFPIWKMGVYSTSLDWLPTVYQILLCWLPVIKWKTQQTQVTLGLAGRQTIITQMMITCDHNTDGSPQGDRMEGVGWGRGRGGGGDAHLHRVSGKASLKR